MRPSLSLSEFIQLMCPPPHWNQLPPTPPTPSCLCFFRRRTWDPSAIKDGLSGSALVKQPQRSASHQPRPLDSHSIIICRLPEKERKKTEKKTGRSNIYFSSKFSLFIYYNVMQWTDTKPVVQSGQHPLIDYLRTQCVVFHTFPVWALVC